MIENDGVGDQFSWRDQTAPFKLRPKGKKLFYREELEERVREVDRGIHFGNTIYEQQTNKGMPFKRLRKNREVREQINKRILFDKRERNSRTLLSTTVATRHM